MGERMNKKTLLIIGAALLAVGALLFFLFGGREAASSDGRLRATELNTSLFADPLFVGLRDFGVAIAPQPVGRRNPFEAFPGDAALPTKGR